MSLHWGKALDARVGKSKKTYQTRLSKYNEKVTRTGMIAGGFAAHGNAPRYRIAESCSAGFAVCGTASLIDDRVAWY
jgi:hypothetical protein